MTAAVKGIVLKLDEGWKASRQDSGLWLYYKGSESSWTPPRHFNSCWAFQLDARWQAEHPESPPLPPRAPLDEKLVQRHINAREYRRCFPAVASLALALPSPESTSWSSPYTDPSAAPRPAAADAAARRALADAIAASPGPWTTAQAESTWRQLAFAMLKPDAALHADVRQKLTTAPFEVTSQPAFPAAVSCMLGAAHSDLARTAVSIATLLDRFKPLSEAEGAGVVGVVPSAITVGVPKSRVSAIALQRQQQVIYQQTLAQVIQEGTGKTSGSASFIGSASVAPGRGSGLPRGVSFGALTVVDAAPLPAGGDASFLTTSASAPSSSSLQQLTASSSGADVMDAYLARLVLQDYTPHVGRTLWEPRSSAQMADGSSGSSGNGPEAALQLPSPLDDGQRCLRGPAGDWVARLGESALYRICEPACCNITAPPPPQPSSSESVFVGSPRWRSVAVQLANAQCMADGGDSSSGEGADPFLRHILHAITAAGHLRDAAAASELETSAALTFRVAEGVAVNRAGFGMLPAAIDGCGAPFLNQSAASVSSVALSPPSSADDLALSLRSELAALTTLHIAGAAVAALAAAPTPPLTSIALGAAAAPRITSSVQQQQQSQALALGRCRQEMGYALLAKSGDQTSAFASALSVAPIPAVTVAVAPAAALSGSMVDDSGAAPTAGLLAAVISLRMTALRLFATPPPRTSSSSVGLSLQEDLFPDETIVTAVARADKVFPCLPVASIAQQASVGASASFMAEEVAAAQVDHMPALRRYALCAAPASLEDAEATVHALSTVSQFLLKPTELATAQSAHAGFAAAVAAAAQDDEAGDASEAAAQLAAFDVILQGTAFCARALSQPDVIALLLHLLFHPESALGDVRDSTSAEEDDASRTDLLIDTLANALAWAALHASGRGSEGAACLNATDSGFPSELLQQNNHSPSEVTDEARHEADRIYLGALTQALAHWAKARSVSESHGGPLHSASAWAVLAPPPLDQRRPPPPASRDEALAIHTLTTRTAEALAFPLVALGVLHTLRATLLTLQGVMLPVPLGEARSAAAEAHLKAGAAHRLSAAHGAARLACTLALRWPALAPNAIALLRQALLCVAAEEESASAASAAASALTLDPAAVVRFALLDLLVDVALGTGFVLPVLELAVQGVAGGGVTAKVALAVQRKLLSSFIKAARPPVSLPFAVGIARLACAIKPRITQNEHLTNTKDEQAAVVEMLRQSLNALPPLLAPGTAHTAPSSGAPSMPSSLAAATPGDLGAEFRGLVFLLDQP